MSGLHSKLVVSKRIDGESRVSASKWFNQLPADCFLERVRLRNKLKLQVLQWLDVHRPVQQHDGHHRARCGATGTGYPVSVQACNGSECSAYSGGITPTVIEN